MSVFAFVVDSNRWLGIVIALVHPFVALPIAFFVFFKGYFGAAMGKGYFTFYRLGETLIITIGFFVFFFSLFGYHGPLFIVLELGNPKKDMILVGLCGLETLVFLVGIFIRIICIMKVNTTFDAEDDF